MAAAAETTETTETTETEPGADTGTGPEAAEGGRIVVGVDGSNASENALRWAARQAELTGARLDAICSWEYPVFSSAAMAFPIEDFEESSQRVLDDALVEVLGPNPTLPVSKRVVVGNAAQVLIEASGGADLLVVGSRGLGGFSGLLLGSVSQHCVSHAPCPVVVTRDT